MQSGYSDKEFTEPPFAFCVIFFRQESFRTPVILLFEMNRNITEEELSERNHIDKHWMDCAEVDALPFLYYLQYTTYGGLGERYKQLHELRVFRSYICDRRNQMNLYHTETAANLLGHCFDIERKYCDA
ncbi:hypothetical protein DPMN_158162 [Dreissena polymorpha]|uniref:Uncharacterized protein n=1 Tax=Dreissena polymorpha TaxID=45954 RepID=A0A9D4IPJ1_DREPO|nr:hypothetical protein DPMN_158162 [Dreissena polymorpha]